MKFNLQTGIFALVRQVAVLGIAITFTACASGDKSATPQKQNTTAKVEQTSTPVAVTTPTTEPSKINVETELKKLDIAKPGFKVGIVISESGVNCRIIPDAKNGKVIDKLAASTIVNLIGVTKTADGKIWDRLILDDGQTDCFAIASSIDRLVPDAESGETELPTQDQIKRQNDQTNGKSIAEPEVTQPAVTYQTPPVSSSGRCDYPDDIDSRGRRCGKRAASVRKGGRLGGDQ